jgi:hypothetical protein
MAVGMYVVAWWWTARLVSNVIRDDYTQFSPSALGVLLAAVVVAGSALAVAVLVRLLRHAGAPSRRLVATCSIASVAVWSAAIGLTFVTIHSIV